MIQEIGVVEKIQGEYALVKVDKKGGGCEQCAAKSACCGSGSNSEQAIIQAANSVGAKTGDTVKVEIDEKSLLKASFLLYSFPIIALAVGGFVGTFLHPCFNDMSKDAVSALSALIFLIISIALVKIIGRKATKDSKYLPKIVEIIY